MAAYQYVFVMKEMTKAYPGGKTVLDKIWLSFLPGVKIGVLGPNGSGKSSHFPLSRGRLRVNDRHVLSGLVHAIGNGLRYEP